MRNWRFSRLLSRPLSNPPTFTTLASLPDPYAAHSVYVDTVNAFSLIRTQISSLSPTTCRPLRTGLSTFLSMPFLCMCCPRPMLLSPIATSRSAYSSLCVPFANLPRLGLSFRADLDAIHVDADDAILMEQSKNASILSKLFSVGVVNGLYLASSVSWPSTCSPVSGLFTPTLLVSLVPLLPFTSPPSKATLVNIFGRRVITDF